MRFWLVLFMVVLLPLRGWAGEAMASGAMQHHVAAAQASQDAAEPVKAAPLPCHGMAADIAAVDEAATGTAPGGTCCLQCQMCSPVATQPQPASMAAPALPHAVPAAAPPRFASALPHRILKPPISLA